MSSSSGSASDKVLTPTQIGAAFQQAAALHGRGDLAQAHALYADIVKRQPKHFDALHGLGVIAYQTRDFRKAAELIAQAIELFPDSAVFHSNYGLALLDMGNLAGALAAFDRAITLNSNFAGAFSNKGNALHMLGRYPEALANCERAIALAPRVAGAHYNRAQTLHALGRLTDALASYDQCVALAPDYADAQVNRGNVLQELNRHEDAIAAYDRVLAADNTVAAAYANRGMVHKSLGRLDHALSDFERALAIDGTLAFVYSARGAIHKQQGRLDQALADFTRAVELGPGNFEAQKDFFWIQLWRSADASVIDRMSAELARTKADLDVATLRSNKRIPGFRLLHDLEQAEYLAREYPDLDGLADARVTLSAIHARADEGLKEAAVSESEIEVVGRFRTNVLRYAPELPQVAVNPNNNWSAIEDRYLTVKPEIVVIDNFLTPEGLKQLRQFCLVSNVWRTDYGNEYLGAFPEDGFISPLHLQIAAELRRVMPRVIGDHTLEQMWAFKYTSRACKGIGIHADFARVNLNFWITPDDANLDPASGGMEIYDIPAPREWDFRDYNGASEKIYAFLKANNAANRTVPYKCNRAVMFNSNLFHKTADIRFKDGYENRRMNVTYLFGVGLGFP